MFFNIHPDITKKLLLQTQTCPIWLQN